MRRFCRLAGMAKDEKKLPMPQAFMLNEQEGSREEPSVNE